MIYSELGLYIKDSLRSPTDWGFNEFTARHKSGLCLWIGSGAFFFDIHEGAGCIGIIERHFLWRHMKKALRAAAMDRLKGLRNG